MKLKKILILYVFLLIFVLTGCMGKNTNKDLGLLSVESAEHLKDLLKQTQNNKSSIIGGWRDFDNALPEASQPTSDEGGSDYTKTNVQVEGVDEGDIIKTDGNRIYSIRYNRLQVVEILPEGQMKVLLREQISTDANNRNYWSYTDFYSELYITDKYLVVIGQKYEQHEFTVTTDDAIDLPYSRWSTLSIISLYDINTLVKIDRYEISGYLLGTRLIDDNLYVISNHTLYSHNFDQEDFDPRPYFIHNDETTIADFKDIKFLPKMEYRAFTIITTVKLNNSVTYENNIFLGSNYWAQIYVSKNAIYLASSVWEENLLGIWRQNGVLVSYQFDNNGTVFYGGAGYFKGRIINQFAMDEYDGYMRIVTSDGWGDSAKNRLYVFKRAIKSNAYVLEVVGSIEEGLGKPRETVFSVRFNKDKATVVTFERIDPFYTIDLSDPTKPTIKGELEVPGFSLYQHPWTEDIILGIGFEADERGIATAMKLALYDISDFENPVELGEPLLLNDSSSWSFSEVLYNHKALLVDQSRGFFGFSLYRYDSLTYKSVNDYLVFDIDVTRKTPIQIKYTITHQTYNQSNDNHWWWYNSYNIERAVRIDDYLYVISGEVITSHNLIGDFSTVDVIIFDELFK